MKRPVIAVWLFFALAVSAVAVSRNEFSGRTKATLAPVYINDGDTMSPFVATASSTSWSTVAAARATRRRIRIQVLDSNAFRVCIGTITASGTACDDSAGGVELSTGPAGISWVDIYTQNAITARARAGSSGEKLKGYEAYDSGD